MDPRPLARHEGLLTKAVGEELLVYDLVAAKAYSLNPVAAAIWRACDGRRPRPALMAAVRERVGAPVAESAVQYGLAILGRAGLLSGSAPSERPPSRRQLLARLGTAAAIPAVLTVVVPSAVHAQSGGPGSGEDLDLVQVACVQNSDCTFGNCLNVDTLEPCSGPGDTCSCSTCSEDADCGGAGSSCVVFGTDEPCPGDQSICWCVVPG